MRNSLTLPSHDTYKTLVNQAVDRIALPILDKRYILNELKLSDSALYRMIKSGHFPAADITPNSRLIRWSQYEYARWIAHPRYWQAHYSPSAAAYSTPLMATGAR